MSKRWLIVVNGNAGRGPAPYARVRAAVADVGLDADVVETSDLGGLGEVVARAVAGGASHFAAVGGDGSAHHLLNAVQKHLIDRRPTFGIIPAGSGSDFARMFGQEQGAIEVAVSRLVSPDLYPIDIGLARGGFGERFFLNSLDVGVVAESAARAERLPRWLGGLRYTAAFWLALWGFQGGSPIVRTDRHVFDGDALTVVAANGQFFGGGLNIAPRATVEDGHFDVQVISGPKRVAFSVMPRVIWGAHLSHPSVRRYVGTRVEIDAPAHWPIEADGEILGHGPVSVECLPNALDYVL